MSTRTVPTPRPAEYAALRHGYLVNARSSLPRAWRLLWRLGYEVFASEGKDPDERKSPRFDLRARLRRFARTARLFAGYLIRGSGTVSLPVEGDVAITRDSGAYKVLDLGQRRLYTVMTGPEAATVIARRAELASRAARYSFAPAVTGVDVEAGWLSEEYVPGRHPTGFDGCSERFEELYLPLLLAFLRSERIEQTTLHAYADELIARIFVPGGLLERLPADRRVAVTNLVRYLQKLIAESPDRPLPLALSHGDFFSGNVFIPEEGRQLAIDWANLGTRSPLHDLYFLVHNHCVRVQTSEELRSSLQRKLGSLRSNLARLDPERFADLTAGLTDDHVWRWIFYLECIETPLERCVRPDERYVESMMLRVGWFEEFEREFGQGAALSAAPAVDGATRGAA